jgi:hypothetical protein
MEAAKDDDAPRLPLKTIKRHFFALGGFFTLHLHTPMLCSNRHGWRVLSHRGGPELRQARRGPAGSCISASFAGPGLSKRRGRQKLQMVPALVASAAGT